MPHYYGIMIRNICVWTGHFGAPT